MTEPVLRVENLTIEYRTGGGSVLAVNGVSFEIPPGRVVGIVGETGCGKSTLGFAIPRLLPEPPARVVSGKIVFQGMDLLEVPKWKMPLVRGTGIGMISQEPINSLHPAYRIQDQLAEAIRIRRLRESGKQRLAPPSDNGSTTLAPMDRSSTAPPTASLPDPEAEPAGSRRAARELRREALHFLRLVRINDPERILGLFPHELSGGMRQRVMIAMALSARPALLIADEPTSALDVTIQAQVLTLMKELMDEVSTSILFISHDLGVIAEMADDVGVMYAGYLAEFGPVGEILHAPRHPYTRALLRAIPRRYKADGGLPTIPGSVPNLGRLPVGCPFRPRCPIAESRCAEPPVPPLQEVSSPSTAGAHRSACHFPERVVALA